MESRSRISPSFLPAFTWVMLAGPSLLAACQTGFLPAMAIQFLAADSGVANDFSKSLATPTPQYPMRLIGYDGTTYTYQSDCCQIDRHTGVILSKSELTSLGCGGTGVEGVEIELPTETFGVAHAGQTEKNITICMGEGFDVASTSPVGPVKSYGDAGSFGDYYGGMSHAATAVQMTDSNGVVRFYTLMKMESFGTFSNGGKPVQFRYQIPVLTLSRSTEARKVDFADGRLPRDVAPEKKIVVDGQVAVDLSVARTELVTIQLPNPTTGNLEDVTCLLVNRTVSSTSAAGN